MQVTFSVASLGVVDGLEVTSELINTDGSVLVRVHDGEPLVVAIAGQAEVGAGGGQDVEPGLKLSWGEAAVVVWVVLIKNWLGKSVEISHLFISFCLKL